jgi:hypothetical protein
MMGNTPNVHTTVVTRSVLGIMGIMSVFRALDADIPPAFHVFQKVADAHTGKIDGGRIS